MEVQSRVTSTGLLEKHIILYNIIYIFDVVRVKRLFTLVLISVFFRTIPTNTDYRQC